jgi:hypothetical protein
LRAGYKVVRAPLYWTEGFDALATKKNLMQHSMVDWCVAVIIDNDISETAKLLFGQTKTNYLSLANDAKTQWSHR